MDSATNKKKWYLKWWAIILWIILTIFLILLVAFTFLLNDIIKQINNPSQELTGAYLVRSLENQKKYDAEGINNQWTGATNPKVTIVEFADFQCPNCISAYKTVREIGIKYKDDVKIIFRDYPVYEGSINIAMAARCAGNQGLFWPMHDMLFQKKPNSDINTLTNLAVQLGANKNDFLSCMQSKKQLPYISKDYTDGINMGVTGTPTFFINGYKIPGNIPRDIFIMIIEELLKK